MNKNIFGLIIALASMLSLSAQEELKWGESVGVTIDETTQTITKISEDGWGSSIKTENQIRANEDGEISYTIKDLSISMAIGLSTKNSQRNLVSMDYAIQLMGDNISIYQKGKFKGKYGKAQLGDKITLERLGENILLKKNDKQIRKINTNPEHTLYGELVLYKGGEVMEEELKVNFRTPFEVSYTKQDVNCDEGANGSIDLEVTRGLKIPIDIYNAYNYEWSNGATTQDLNHLDLGKYEVVVTDYFGKKERKTVNILAEVTWTDLEGLTSNDGDLGAASGMPDVDAVVKKLIKEGGQTNAEFKEGAAASLNTLAANQDGFLQYEIEDIAYTRVIGLAYENVLGKSYYTTDYAMYFSKKGRLSIFESGKYVGEFGEYAVGDEITIERSGNWILYAKNGNALRKVQADATRSMLIDVALLESGATLNNVKTNFCYSLEATFRVNHLTSSNLGSILVEPKGGAEPYIFLWEDSDIQTQGRGDLNSGTYHVTITDADLNSVDLDISVGFEIEWNNVNGLTLLEDYISKAGEPGWGTGTATMSNSINSDAVLSIKISELNTEWAFGLREYEKEQANSYSDLDYGFYIDESNVLYIVDNKRLHTIGEVVEGDVISIEKSEDKITYKNNETVLRESGYSKEKEYVVDVTVSSANLNPIGPFTLMDMLYALEPMYPVVSVTGTITHMNCYQKTGGSINITAIASQVADNFTYEWSSPNGFSSTQENIDNLEAGVYTVIATTVNQNYYGNLGGAGIEWEFEVGYEVYWNPDTRENVTAANNSLVKHYWSRAASPGTFDPVGSAWNAGGSSVNKLLGTNIPDNGSTSFTLDKDYVNYPDATGSVYYPDNGVFVYGLTKVDDNVLPGDIEFGIEIYKAWRQWNGPSSTIYHDMRYAIYKNGIKLTNSDIGSLYYLSNIMGECNVGDVFTIERDDNTISYYKNGNQIYSWTDISNPVTNADYIVDASIYYSEGDFPINNTQEIEDYLEYPQIHNAMTTFPCHIDEVKAQYAELSKKLDGSFYRTDGGQLFIKYKELYNDGSLNYKIYNKVGVTVLSSAQFPNSKRFGTNWYQFDLTLYPEFVIDESYILEITNDKGLSEYLRFKFKLTND
jgi:hypothetical protein